MSDLGGVIDAFIADQAESGVHLLGSGDGIWDVLVPSYWKETIGVTLILGDRHLRAEAFFMRAPDDNPAKAYRLFLQRNERSGPWRFTANEAGDVGLLALIPVAAVTEDELDRLFGTLITVTDETYVPAMKIGFEKGLDEQVRRGGPGLDQPPPWARD